MKAADPRLTSPPRLPTPTAAGEARTQLCAACTAPTLQRWLLITAVYSVPHLSLGQSLIKVTTPYGAKVPPEKGSAPTFAHGSFAPSPLPLYSLPPGAFLLRG